MNVSTTHGVRENTYLMHGSQAQFFNRSDKRGFKNNAPVRLWDIWPSLATPFEHIESVPVKIAAHDVIPRGVVQKRTDNPGPWAKTSGWGQPHATEFSPHSQGQCMTDRLPALALQPLDSFLFDHFRTTTDPSFDLVCLEVNWKVYAEISSCNSSPRKAGGIYLEDYTFRTSRLSPREKLFRHVKCHC